MHSGHYVLYDHSPALANRQSRRERSSAFCGHPTPSCSSPLPALELDPLSSSERYAMKIAIWIAPNYFTAGVNERCGWKAVAENRGRLEKYQLRSRISGVHGALAARPGRPGRGNGAATSLRM